MWWRRGDAARLDADGFDADWYRATYPDVDPSGLTAHGHYLRYGQNIGRDPSPDFSAQFHREVFEISPGREPMAAMRGRTGKPLSPSEGGRVLAAAARLARTGDDGRALRLAGRYLPEPLAYTSAILRANAALRRGDRSDWLTHLNAYLAHFALAPVSLTGNAPGLWDRLGVVPAPSPIEEGPLVSIIMAAWNASASIDMAVTSLLRQSWRRIEVLIVDDGSTDGTWARIEAIAARDKRIRTFRNSINAGPYVTKNLALSQARGFFVTGHDADDWAHPERIARQVRFCLDGDRPASLASMLRMSAEGEFVRLNPIGGRVHDGASRAAFIGLMIDAQLMHGALGGWDEVRMSGDSELIARLEHMLGGPLPSSPEPVMLCLDNPDGLTNHPTLGYSETGGVSPHRLDYMRGYRRAHAFLTFESARYPMPIQKRLFPAPAAMMNAAHTVAAVVRDQAARGLQLQQEVTADVAIVTSLAYRGGNTSSTLEEVEYLAAQGLDVVLVHTPTLRQTWESAAPRYSGASARIVNWTRVGNLKARVVIVRNPVVMGAPAFTALAPRIKADHAFVVVNNSRHMADGTPAYDPARVLTAARAMRVGTLTFCPASPLMREELSRIAIETGHPVRLSDRDWMPTMDAGQYLQPVKPSMTAPFTIGRHGRDAFEKWPEARADLRAAYPAGPDFRISILGGADRAVEVLGGLPSNWQVTPFGEIGPRDYLSNLDAFVNFTHSAYVEAFGRTVAEAMLSGVPAILPASFEPTFDDLAFYVAPANVAGLVRALATEDTGRVAFLTEVQQVVRARHEAAGIGTRLHGTGLDLPATDRAETGLSDSAKAWRRNILAQALK